MSREKIGVIFYGSNRKFFHVLCGSIRDERLLPLTIANTPEELCKKTECFFPDVLIVDDNGSYDGTTAAVEAISPDKRKKIITIVLSHNRQEAYIKDTISKGAAYYMLKPIHPEELWDRVVMFADYEKRRNSPVLYKSIDRRGLFEEKTVEKMIVELLYEIGIPSKLKGFSFIQEAVKMAVRDNELLFRGGKILYHEIGNKFCQSSGSVERDIRGAIQTVDEIAVYRHLHKKSEKEEQVNNKLTNMEFITLAADAVSEKYRDVQGGIG